MDNREHLYSFYEHQVNRVLQRVDPIQFGYDTRLAIKNNPHKGGPFKLSQRNREIVLSYYKKLKNEGIALARLVSVIGVASRLLEILEKDLKH